MAGKRGIRAWRGVLIALALLPLTVGVSLRPGRAAGPPPAPLNPGRMTSMQVLLVRDPRPDCGGACAEWIAAEGAIDTATPGRFAAVLKRLGGRRLPVFVDSPGGRVEAAIAVGRMIRARHLDVVVTQTTLDPCAAGDATCAPARGDGSRPGHPHGARSICASACVLILAAGGKREAATWTGVGVHQIIQQSVVTRVRRLFRVVTRMVGGRRTEVSRTLVSVTPVSKALVTVVPPRSGYGQISAYLAAMGIGPGLVPLMLATPHESIHWLTPGEEVVTGIVTDHVDGEFLVAGAYPPASRDKAASQPGTGPAGGSAAAPSRLGNAHLAAYGEPQPSAGSVTWTFDEPGQPPAYVDKASLRADLSFPDVATVIALRIDQEPPVAGLAFYHLVLTVLHGASSLVHDVTAARLTYSAPTSPWVELPLGTLTRTADDVFEFTLGRDDVDHLFPPGASASPPFKLSLTLDGWKAATVLFDPAQGADPAIAAARKRFSEPPPQAAAASGS